LNAELHQLFDITTAPDTSYGLTRRLALMRQKVAEARVFALRCQGLVVTTLATVRHLSRLVGAIGDFVGGMQARQTIAQLDANLTKAATVLEVTSVTFQRAETLQALEQPMILESIQKINAKVWR